MTTVQNRRPSAVLVSMLAFALGPPRSVPLRVAQAQKGEAPKSQGRENIPKAEKQEAEEKKKPVQVQAWEILTAGAADEKPSRRSEAVVALGSIGLRKKAVQLVEAGLNDKDVSVRQLAATTLGDMKSRTSIPKLKESLNDEAPEVSFAAATALWSLGDRSGRAIFIEVLSGERPSSPGMVKSKVRQFHDPKALAVIGAREAVGALLGPLAFGISLAEELAKDRSAAARVLSASLLGGDRNPDAIRELDDALSDKNWAVRAAAARALGNTHLPTQVRHLDAVLEDEKDTVRYEAAASIIRLLENGRDQRAAKGNAHSIERSRK